MQEISINKQLFELITPDGKLCFGGNQEWFEEKWHKMSGCGPVAACNLVWYQARSRSELHCLCDTDGGFEDYRKLMDTMYAHITPGRGGIHNSGLFIPGLLKYCAGRGAEMTAESLDIPRRRTTTTGEVCDFVTRWLENDCPVAFLNRSNGALPLPDSWHWVTIISLEPDSMTATISDEGRTYTADLKKWLKTSLLGGAFVALHAV